MIELNRPQPKNTLMIVDDEPKNIQLLGTLLTQSGYNIIPATNGVKALEKLNKVRPDIILLDVMMPELDGFETCKRIKENPETADIPVIFLTAKVDKDDVIKGLTAGAVDYVTKPFNHRELLIRVKNQIDLINARHELEYQMNTTNELLHVLCHDLTNPIGSIASLLEVVKTQDDLNQIGPMMTSAANDCLEIITLVKAMSAVEVGKTILCITKVDLHEIISSSLQTLSKPIKEKDIEIDFAVPENTFVMAEKVSLKNSIINNLLTNAVKFTHRGGKISISAEPVNENIVLCIKDSGIGIPTDIMDRIFHPGKAGTRKGTEGETGVGFGMPVIKKFMEKYNGTISIRSGIDEGTEIDLTFKKF